MTDDITYIFTLDECYKCDLTKKRFKKNNVPFEEVNLDENPEWKETIIGLGYRAMPVVFTPDFDIFNDFRPDDIAYLSRVQTGA